jgi:lysozyme
LIGWLWLIFAFVVLATIVYSGWLWFDMQSWKPDRAEYPEQGAVIASGTSGTRFETLKAQGADFVYLELAPSGRLPDPGFRARFAAAREAGLKVGVIQPFDPCARADPQSSRFSQMVPRDAGLMPPAIALVQLPTSCNPPVSEAAVTSEVLTLINQIEMHAGKPVVLKLGEAFETKFRIAMMVERELWLIRDRGEPRYAPRPWLLWSANSRLDSEAAAEPIEWVVVQR